MPIVAMPDGTQVSFPDAMPADQIKALIAQKFPSAVAGAGMKPSVPSEGTVSAAPIGDEIVKRGSILPLGKTAAGDIVPALPEFIEGPRRTIMDMIEGKRGPRDISGKEIFELGALFSGASPATRAVESAGAGRAVAKVLEDKTTGAEAVPVKPPAPTTPELKASSQSAYRAADEAGVALKPAAFRNMVAEVATEVKKAGFDKDIQPKAAAALRRLASEIEAGSSPTLGEFDILRQVAKNSATDKDANERRIGRIITSTMDHFVDRLRPEDVMGGNAESGVAALKEARGLWARKAKSEQIDEMFEKAANNAPSYSASGYENALRLQFKALANNPNRMRQFSGDEQDAIRAVVRGDALQKTMTHLGKFSPTAGFFGSLLSGGVVLDAIVRGNPELLAIPAVGAMARFAATKRREMAAGKVSEMVRGGKPMADYMAEQATQRGSTLGPTLGRAGLLSTEGFMGP